MATAWEQVMTMTYSIQFVSEKPPDFLPSTVKVKGSITALNEATPRNGSGNGGNGTNENWGRRNLHSLTSIRQQPRSQDWHLGKVSQQRRTTWGEKIVMRYYTLVEATNILTCKPVLLLLNLSHYYSNSPLIWEEPHIWLYFSVNIQASCWAGSYFP